MSEAMEASVELFCRIGIEETTAQNIMVNPKVRSSVLAVIKEAGVQNGCNKSVGNVLYTVATKYPANRANALRHRPKFLSYVTSGKIKSHQLDAAFRYFSSDPEEFLVEDFERVCGVGVVVSPEDAELAVEKVLEKNKAKLLDERYKFNVGILLAQVRELQPFADFTYVKKVIDKKMYELLGERTAEDDVKTKKKKPKPEEVKKEEILPVEEVSPYSIFPKPEDNIGVHVEIRFSDGTVLNPANTKAILEKHLKATGGRVYTRFPPEPNGYLHIGHAKAMFVDFGFACDANGCCYLRFDDTNPDAEKEEYIEHIKEIVEWMGWKPFKITYSSDYFQELYELAVELIKSGHAYVDHQTADEIKEYRENFKESPWRNRPVEESLDLFEKMKAGLIEEGQATLRMKQDMKNENYNMLDLIAYRVKKASHPRTKDKWCIYPSYDFTHCIVDSLENISHSLCTLEFESRRVSYYWLLDRLNLYLPYVWEYSRLNMTNNVLSKRKLNRLVTEKYVDGWDDPRLLTLAGLRRRGMPATAINAFCRSIGITRSDNLIRMDKLEHFVRDELNKTAPRTMVVLHPLKVVIENLEAAEEVEGKRLPDDPSATYKMPFTRVVYIERSDFRTKDSKDFYGLAKGKSALLRYAYPITCVDYVCDKDGEVIEIRATYDAKKSIKPKGVLHWVPEPAEGARPLEVEVRLFDRLFLSEDPAELKDTWLEDLNPHSKQVIHGAFALDNLRTAKPGDRFQFERTGYFCVDPDSSAEKLVFNRTVTLKTSYP
ncbi:glutamine--tRNA ligase, cytoplasmic isoform X2 [Selaginella moellendorffii]|nr:glutamine--tRNA ligase, cytoplasmic isoform X2 [Selaginella moellendorffii]|eukprot:XP_002966775.2 glutamine--tRNA ligase, cytoplasmic isoform X2 [Selaginella moellendorffii]